MKNIKILLPTIVCSMICFSCISEELHKGKTPKYDKIVIDLNDKIYNGITDNTTKPTLMLWNENGPVLTEQSNLANLITAKLPPQGEYNMIIVTNLDNISLISTNNYNTVAAQYAAVNQTNPKLDKFYAKSLGTLVVNDNKSQFFEKELELYNRCVNVNITLDNAAGIIETASFSISGMAQAITLTGKKLSPDASTQLLNYTLNVAEDKLTTKFNMFGMSEGTQQNLTLSIKAKNETPKQLTTNLTKTFATALALNPSNNVDFNVNIIMFAEIINGEYIFSLQTISLDDDEVIIDGEI